jgi:hypothetical protein
MILDIIAIAGITIVITTSKLFKPLREFITGKSLFFGRLLSCALCTGVWIGLLFFLTPVCLRSALHYVFIGSLASETVYLIIERLKIK